MQNDLNLTKATLVLINTVGYPIARQITVQRSIVESHVASGHRSLVLQYVEKGHRKPHATRFAEDAELAIYEGWHNVEMPDEFAIFDTDLLGGMKAQINASPVFEMQ